MDETFDDLEAFVDESLDSIGDLARKAFKEDSEATDGALDQAYKALYTAIGEYSTKISLGSTVNLLSDWPWSLPTEVTITPRSMDWLKVLEHKLNAVKGSLIAKFRRQDKRFTDIQAELDEIKKDLSATKKERDDAKDDRDEALSLLALRHVITSIEAKFRKEVENLDLRRKGSFNLAYTFMLNSEGTSFNYGDDVIVVNKGDHKNVMSVLSDI